jgi:hypothetical protein
MKGTMDGIRKLLSLSLLQLAIAILPKNEKGALAKHIRAYIQEQISQDTI